MVEMLWAQMDRPVRGVHAELQRRAGAAVTPGAWGQVVSMLTAALMYRMWAKSDQDLKVPPPRQRYATRGLVGGWGAFASMEHGGLSARRGGGRGAEAPQGGGGAEAPQLTRAPGRETGAPARGVAQGRAQVRGGGGARAAAPDAHRRHGRPRDLRAPRPALEGRPPPLSPPSVSSSAPPVQGAPLRRRARASALRARTQGSCTPVQHPGLHPEAVGVAAAGRASRLSTSLCVASRRRLLSSVAAKLSTAAGQAPSRSAVPPNITPKFHPRAAFLPACPFSPRCPAGRALDAASGPPPGDIHPYEQRFGLYPTVLLGVLSLGMLAPSLVVFRPPPSAEILRGPAQGRKARLLSPPRCAVPLL